MKIVYFGDLHITSKPAPGALNLYEQQSLLDKYLIAVESERPEMVIITGDVFQGRTNPIERVVAMTFTNRVKQICPVKIIKGNHDQLHDLYCLGTATCIIGCSVHEHPVVVGDNILLLPWCSDRRGLLGTLETYVGRGFELVFGHLEMSEVIVGGGLLGTHSQAAISIHDLFELGAQHYGLGHIHSAQRFVHPETGAVIEYAGSIRPTAFGHGGDEYGYVVLDNSSGRWASNRKIIDCPKMITVRLEKGACPQSDAELRSGDAIRVKGEASRADYKELCDLANEYVEDLKNRYDPRCVIKDLKVKPEQRSRVDLSTIRTYSGQDLNEIAPKLTEQWWSTTERPTNAERVLDKLRGYLNEAD